MRKPQRVRIGLLNTITVLLLAIFLPAQIRAENATIAAGLGPVADVIKHAEINPDVPVFVPVHPRIATTISFPRPIGAPVGTGFVEADAPDDRQTSESHPSHSKGDYVIAYTEGETFFTVQPGVQSELLNLNVPYEGSTLVLYFYLVDKPLSAVASLVFVEKGTSAAKSHAHILDATPAETGRIQKTETLPSNGLVPATPARLDGLLRKLRAIHAAKLGAELDDLAEAMKLKVAVSSAELDGPSTIPHTIGGTADFQLILLRAARDPALDAVGFVVLFRNTSKREVIFDLRSLSARCGAALYTAQVVEAPARLAPGEIQPGYFAIVGAGDGRPAYLLPNNDWRLSISEAADIGIAASVKPSGK